MWQEWDSTVSGWLEEPRADRRVGRDPAPALTCAACDCVPAAPVAAPCGHALCGAPRRCWPCPRCSSSAHAAPDAPPARTAVLLRAVLAACCPKETQAQQLLLHGDPQAALILAERDESDGKEPSPVLLSLQCHALHLLGRNREAIAVASRLKKLVPTWSRSHYWCGCFLLLACRPQEAIASLLLSIALSAGYAPSNPPGMPCARTLIQIGMAHFHSMSESRLQSLLNWVLDEAARLRRLQSKCGSELVCIPENLPPGLEESDFDCVLCSRILWKPVTTPCGHTFCAGCLDRCLDHTAACPLCMTPLHDLLSSPRAVSVALETAIKLLLPVNTLSARELSEQAELAAPAHVPVFVCTVSWPGVPCPLYVFEPRYRLLVRRCIEAGGKKFGMAAGVGHGFVDVGTLLDVRDWLRLPDGCSLLTAVGARRFYVASRGEQDGYHTARIELLQDKPPAPGVKELAERVRLKAQLWVDAMPAATRTEVERAFGRMPEPEPDDWCSTPDGPTWSWWLLAILPLSPKLQVAILATTSLEKRLHAINKMLDHVQQTTTS